jgi:YVTN family beta-propeller protein
MARREYKVRKRRKEGWMDGSFFLLFLFAIFLALLTGCGDDETPVNIPPPPTGLEHTLAKGKVSLRWQGANYAENYRVYRGTQLDSSFQVIGTTNKTAYDDIQVVAGATYIYKVAGVSSDGVEGKPSAPYQVTYQEGILDIPKDSIDFSKELTHHDLTLKNIGGLTLHWTIETKENWISIEPDDMAGDLKPKEEKVVRITVERQGEPKEYKGAVLVKTDTGEEILIPVRMEIPPEPHITIDSSSISFQGVEQTHTLTIQNTGTGILEWEIRNIPSWLELDETKGNTSNTSPSRIQLKIKVVEELQPDKTYTATLIVVSNDSSAPERTVNVTLYVNPKPQITIHPPEISFGDVVEILTLTIQNTGTGILEWEFKNIPSWLELGETRGKTSKESPGRIQLKIKDAEKLQPDKTYTATISVVSNDSNTPEQMVNVILYVKPKPQITINPSSISFQGVEQTYTLTIQNTGTGILEWEFKNIPSWLELDETRGKTSKESPSRIQLKIKDAEKLQPDKPYTATISVVSNDASTPELTVNVILRMPPKLDITSADKHLIFKLVESTRNITIRNVGGGVMTWRVQVEPAATWLKIHPQQGETEPNQPDLLTFTVDREQGIPGKTLKTTVVIDAGDAGVERIIIEVSIPEESWVVSPEALILDGSTPENILISNTGEGQLYWSASSSDPSWILLAKKNGAIEHGKTDSLQVSANLTSLTLGEHEGEVRLTTRGGKQESIKVQIVKRASIPVAVLDSRSGLPVRDVQISLDNQIPETYPTGDFEIERKTPGAFHLEAKKNGYLPAVFDGILDDRGNTKPVEMWLRPIPRVALAIFDAAKPFEAPVDICLPTPGPSQEGRDGTRIYVSDELGSVSVIDALTDMVIDKIKDIGIHPMGIIAHPLVGEVYIADAEAHKVIILDANSLKVVNRIDVDKYPQQLTISQDGRQLYVTCRDSDSVVLIDTERRQVDRRFPVGRAPYGIAISPDGRVLYVANHEDSTVSVVDAITGQQLQVIPVASRPQHLAVSEQYVYVSNSLGDRVSVINQTSRKLVKHIEMGNAILLGDIAVLEEPKGGDVIYVINQTNNALQLIDSVTMEVIDEEIPVGDMPIALAIRPDLTKIYVVNSGSADISVLEFR